MAIAHSCPSISPGVCSHCLRFLWKYGFLGVSNSLIENKKGRGTAIVPVHACLVPQSRPSLASLCTLAHPTPLFMGFCSHGYWSGLPYPPPEDLPDPGIEPASPVFPALAGGFFTTSATWKDCNSTWEGINHRLRQWLQWTHLSSIQSLSCVWLFVTPWTAACQASLSITNS